MNLTVLVDNNTIIDNYLKGEPALSFYIEDEDVKILFDTGYSDLFLQNALKLKIDIEDIDYIVLSHGHDDHTGGLEYLLNLNFKKQVTIIAHPLTFNPKIDTDGLKIGSPVDINALKKKFNVVLTSKVMDITKNIMFLGEIPRDKFQNEPIGTVKIDESYHPDKLLDDTALVYKNNNEMTIITGCSHCGIINIIDYAEKITSINSIKAIIGGFHLLQKCENECRSTIDYLNKNEIQKIYPCHCTDLYAKCQLSKHFDIEQVGSGSCFVF